MMINVNMDKKTILRAVIEKLTEQRSELERSLKTVHQGVVDSPSATQSHSDTTRFQMRAIEDKINSTLAEKEKAIAALEELSQSGLPTCRAVEAGAIVEVKGADGKSTTYFILPQGGGVEIESEGKRITTTTLLAPFAAALQNKTEGDVVRFEIPSRPGNVREMTVTKVW